jgi:hypothetical protein
LLFIEKNRGEQMRFKIREEAKPVVEEREVFLVQDGDSVYVCTRDQKGTEQTILEIAGDARQVILIGCVCPDSSGLHVDSCGRVEVKSG